MSFSTYLTEKVTGMAKDKVDEFFEKIKEKVEYEKLVKSIEVTIEEECIRMDEVNFNGYSDRIKQIIRNYNYIDKILHYWTGIEFDYRCSKEMIDALTANIAGFDNLTVLNAKSLLNKISRQICCWIENKCDEQIQMRLFISKRFDVYFERDYEDEHNVKKQISIEEKTIDSVSKSLYLTVAKSTLLNDSVYDSNLFGTISGEGIEECSNLWEIRNSLPKILFLSGTGGSGKTTHLRKFQYDAFKGHTDENNEDSLFFPIYITLSYKSSNETIKSYIISHFPVQNENIEEKNDENKLIAIFSKNDSRFTYIFLLDGLNEYRGNLEDLFNEIKALAEYPKVKIIITSRYNSADVIVSLHKLSDISDAVVNHISKESACKYYGIDSFPTEYPEKTLELLTTPFYMKICKEMNFDLNASGCINASYLMYCYLENNKKRFDEDHIHIITELFPSLCYLSYRKDSISEKKARGDVSLTSISLNELKQTIKCYNERYGSDFSYENVKNAFLDCNLIVRDKSTPFVKFSFKHQNIRDLCAALHVANIVWAIVDYPDHINEDFGSEIEMHADLRDFSNDVADALLVIKTGSKKASLSVGDSITFLLHGNEDYCQKLKNINNLVVLQVLNKISVTREDNILFASEFIRCYEESNNVCIKESLANMYIFSLCQMDQHYRIMEDKNIMPLDSFVKCMEYAKKAKQVYDNSNGEFNSDGYNHVGKCLNSFLEYVLNDLNDFSVIENERYLLVDEAISNLDFAQNVLLECNNNFNDIGLAVYQVLNSAFQAYNSYAFTENRNKIVLNILGLHYVSRAYLAKACLNYSAESLNLMAMILENNYNAKLRQLILEKFGIEITGLEGYNEDRLMLSYRLYDAASRCPHIVRSYSAQKKAIMLIKHQVELQDFDDKSEIERDLNISKRANKPLIEYWYGRYYSDIHSDKEMAQSYFESELNKRCQGKVVDLNTKPNSALMLVLIEWLVYENIDHIDKDIDFNYIKTELTIESLDSVDIHKLRCESRLQREIAYIIMCLKVQKNAVHSQKIVADQFWVTLETVEENLNRFLSNIRTLVGNQEETL